MRLEVYTPSLKDDWDSFISKAKNSHFIFNRDYMDYHSDRFKDFSLLVYNDKENIIALLPANLTTDRKLISHQGLTFGGLILDSNCTAEIVLEIFSSIKIFLSKESIRSFIYKCMPYIYFVQPSDEDRYALFVNGAQLVRRDLSSTIYLENKGRYTKGRKWSINKAKKAGLIFARSDDWAGFWNVLETTLLRRHSAVPAHRLSEIENLANSFQDNIKLFIVKKGPSILGGAVVFENKFIVHTQYMANSTEGRELGALDFLIHNLICDVYSSKKYFDFGISNENNGLVMNSGLIAQKESFGARAVVHDFYEWILT